MGQGQLDVPEQQEGHVAAHALAHQDPLHGDVYKRQALFLFCVVSTLVYLVMEVFAGFRPERAQAVMTSVRRWIESHTDQVIIILSLGLGLWLVGKSIYVLVS